MACQQGCSTSAQLYTASGHVCLSLSPRLLSSSISTTMKTLMTTNGGDCSRVFCLECRLVPGRRLFGDQATTLLATNIYNIFILYTRQHTDNIQGNRETYSRQVRIENNDNEIKSNIKLSYRRVSARCGHSDSLKVIRCCADRRGIYDFLLALNSNLTSIFNHF